MNTVDRYDIYRGIHKAIRMAMGNAILVLGRTDHTDEASVASGIRQLRALLDLCRGHLDHEDRFIHAAIQARRQGIALETAEDHRHHENAIKSLESRARSVEAAAGQDRARALHRLYRELASFVAENFEHMELEENRNNALLWELYSDEEILGIEHRLVESLPPDEALKSIVMILEASTPAERVAKLTPIYDLAPPHVFDAVMTELKSRLSPLDRHKLAIGLERRAAA